ncbi:MAG TPA: ABC transporter substrate-binding protein [Actinopolymorphaceae bacterium]|jgi:peptide/nickel transport system substrate-binding protein
MNRGFDLEGAWSRSSRRDILRLGATLAVIGATPGALTSCSSNLLSRKPAGKEQERSSGAPKGKEAPMLAAKVRAGELPPLEQRLPENPLVVEPVDRIGTYGGEWRTMLVGLTDTAWIGGAIDHETLLSWDRGFTGKVLPNLAEAFEANAEGTVFTLRLRAGVRWSDGEPFTTEDIRFAYEDVLSNREISPVHPDWLCAGGKAGNTPATLEISDERTLRFVFTEPNGLFLHYLVLGGDLLKYPRHYLQQFHKKYEPEVEARAKDDGFATWVEMFHSKAEKWQQVGVPVLTPWMTERPLGEGSGSRFVVVRNPYYWKVDPDGSQLPYLDRVVFEVVSNQEVMVLKITSGEVDMHARHVMSPRNKPIFARSRERGDYQFLDVRTTDFNEMGLYLNLTHPDPALREVFQNKQFRIALSHAINREELIDAVFQRQGEPWQIGPRPESPYYDEQLAKQYTEYDPDLANQMLDDAGFDRRDGNGIRLRRDGKPIAFQIDVGIPSLNEAWVPATELVRKYWREVGIDARVKSEDRTLFFERVFNNQHDAAAYIGEFGDRDAPLWPDAFVPTRIFALYGVGWGQWYSSGGENGMEPPPEVRRQLELFDRVKATVDDEERDELFRQVIAIAREQFYAIGTSLPAHYYGIVKNNFHNVPRTLPGTIQEPVAFAAPEQFFTTA